MSRGWSFWSVIRTRLLFCICFFLLLVEVEGEESVEDIGVEDGDKEGEMEEEGGRPYFSLPA